MHASSPYLILEDIFRKYRSLLEVDSLLRWDSETCMNPRASAARTDQLAVMESVLHAVISDKDIGNLLSEAEDRLQELEPIQVRNLALMRKAWRDRICVPAALRSRLVKAGAECCFVWREARAENDFGRLLPYLTNVVQLVRETAALKAEALGCTPYEALADAYDPGRSEAELDSIFRSLKERVPGLIEEARAAQDSKRSSKRLPVLPEVAPEQQHAFAQYLLQETGLSQAVSRADAVSTHPFCSGSGKDIRITARYHPENVMSGIMALMHEAGHALYEYQLPETDQPWGQAAGMAVHESQSLLMEMHLCRTRPFMQFLGTHLKKFLRSRSKAFEGTFLYESVTQVRPSLIRVDADEVTYPAHVLVRYYIERFLINGEMEVADIPDAWNQGYNRFLGVTPPDFASGCLQDIHWMDGTFGYFPAYTVGAIYAAQLGEAMRHEIDGLAEELERGSFVSAAAWLKERVHRFGSLYAPEELMRRACGSGSDTDPYFNYLRSRYLNRTVVAGEEAAA